MEKNTILKTPLLDIIFEGRNKEYGAYELRSHYNGRLTKALGITFGLGVIVFLSSFLGGLKPKEVKPLFDPKVVTLEKIDPIEPPPVIPPPQQIEKPVATTIYNVPKVVPNDQVKPDETPPEITELEKVKIGNVKIDGDEFKDIVAPPNTTGGVVDAPRRKAEDSVFIKVEKDAEFPGGNSGWAKYVTREVQRNSDELQDDGKTGTVVVLFIVDKEGKVSDVKALPCNEAGVGNCLGAGSKLAEVAVNAIRKGPNWIPAIQNGNQVKAYRRQAVTFQMSEE
jgi:protein TonB